MMPMKPSSSKLSGHVFLIKASCFGAILVSSALAPVSFQTSVAANPLVNNLDYEQSSVQIVSQNTDSSEPEDGADGKSEESKPFFKLSDLRGREVVISVLSAIAGVGLKHLFDERSARNEFKRNMLKNVTTNIEELAKTHYWLLANYSKVLGGLLESYLQSRYLTQLYLYESWDKANSDLEEVKNKYSKEAFYYYSYLMKMIYDFQWRSGNTYFLTNYESGRLLTKLYNRFQSLTEDIDANKIIPYLDLSSPKDTDKTPESQQDIISPSRFHEMVEDEYELDKEFGNFKDWLTKDIGSVDQAAKCLNAYSDLFNAELATVYKDWFSKSQLANLQDKFWKFKKSQKIDKISGDVQNLITDDDSKNAIATVSLDPLRLRPIGSSVDTRKPTIPTEPKDKGGKEKELSLEFTPNQEDKSEFDNNNNNNNKEDILDVKKEEIPSNSGKKNTREGEGQETGEGQEQQSSEELQRAKEILQRLSSS